MKRALVAVAACALLLAACGNGNGEEDPLAGLEDNGENGEEPPGDVDPEDPDTVPDDAVEIFSWWTGAGEEAGLNALIEMFESEYGHEVVNSAVAGGAGTDAQAVLTSRMQANQPPSTFQIHAGRALLDQWVAADAMEPLNDLYDEEGWWEVFPDELLEMTTDEDGNIYSVPVNVHRSNVLFTNTQVFEDNDLTPPTTFDEFFEVADELEAAGVTPLALGDNESWTLLHTWETVLLGTVGPETYQALFDGEADWQSPEVVESFENLERMFGYINDDHSARNWQDAAQLVAEGEAAMNIMGDWAQGYFSTDLEMEPETDFGWEPTPGTDGSFITVVDTFGLPEGAPNREGTLDWLRVLGSVEGQDTFNPLKGSIPARLDGNLEEYNEYGQDTYNDFQDDALVPSLAHNSAAPPNFTDAAMSAVVEWMAQRDAERSAEQLEQAADDFLR